MPSIRLAVEEDLGPCVAIVESLPDYFTPDVPDTIRADWTRCSSWVAVDGARVDGMVMLEQRHPWTAEILWAAVARDRQNGGIGTALVHRALAEAVKSGVRVVEVKTLDESSDYEPYRATRAFWEARGFLKLDMIDPFPGWQPGNPAAIYVRPLEG